MNDVVVLVPRRHDNGPRDELWRFLRPRWEAYGWPVVEGYHQPSEGPFSRAKAINRAARSAGEWRRAVIIDADVWVEPWQLERAVVASEAALGLSYPHVPWWGLSRHATRQVVDGVYAFDPAGWGDHVYEKRTPLANSCCMVVTAELWETVGGYDERFVGWGAEDWAWFAACATLGGPAVRVDAPVYHLWHPPSAESEAITRDVELPTLAANHRLGRRYLQASGNPAAMRMLCRQARRMAER